MLRLDKLIKPWKDAAALSDHINLYGFWNKTTFLTKSGDVGMVLSMPGVDYESLDSAAQEYAVKRLEAALKAFGPGFHVYQYLFKSNRPEIPFAHYDDPVVDAAIEQRRQFFEARRDDLYQIEIFYAIVLEGSRSKTGVGAALTRLFRDPTGGLGELKAQFTNNAMKVLLRSQIEQDLARLDQRVQTFVRQLNDFMRIEVLDDHGQLRFFRRLLNYDEWRISGKPQSTQFLDYQVVNSNIEAERDHLRVGDHSVRVLTMKEVIGETRPLVLDQLLKIPGNFYVVTEWTPLAMNKARKEITKRRRHFNMTKTGFISQMGNDTTKVNPRDVLVDESKQDDIENLGDCLRALGDGQSLGDFSLTIVMYARTKGELDQLVGEFSGVFSNADGNLFVETYNQLNAYFATVPGNYAQNLRKLYLLNTNYADLSFFFTILAGEKHNAHLDAEYLAVLETDNATPYFLNLHNGEVPHTLILGMTGSGKSYFCNFVLQNAQKYNPLTFIFDIGGSFQSLTSIFGGSYLNVGQESRDFTINPFSLPPTKDNFQFLFSFWRVLIEGNGQRYRMDFGQERKLWDGIERIYVLEPEQRTLSIFCKIVGELKERLHRWTQGGQYGFLFDNERDTLSFSRFQTFNFHGWDDAPEVLEPLLFYVLHRATAEIADPNKLATFKMFLLDEAWLFIKNETIRNYVVQAQKSPAYCAARVRLTELSAPVVEAFYADEIGVGHALLLAKLQPAQQEQALANCFREGWAGAGAKAKRILLPVRHLQQWLEQNVLLVLKQAPFDKRDSQLVPSAGSCVDCPKRTGHNKLLFADLSGSSDACSDPNCYAAKLEAHVRAAVAAKPELVQISTAYKQQAEGEKAIPRNKYVEIKEEKPDTPEKAKWPEFRTCKHSTEAIIADGINTGELRKVCTEPTCPIHHAKKRPQQTADDSKWKAEQEKQRTQEALAQATGLRTLAAIAAAVPVRLMKRDLLFVVERLAGLLDERRLEIVARGRSIKKAKDSDSVQKPFKAYLRGIEENALSSLLVEITILHWATRHNAAEVFREAATVYKVDVDGIESKVKQEFAAKEKAKLSKKPFPKKLEPKAAKTA